MKETTKKPSFFDASSLTILNITYDKEPTIGEFAQEVKTHAGLLSDPSVTAPRNKCPICKTDAYVHGTDKVDVLQCDQCEELFKKSSAIWLTFPINDKMENLFYVCFPSTKKNKKCWSIGFSNKGDGSEEVDAAIYNKPEALTNNPFEALGKIAEKGVLEIIPAEQTFLDKCPEVERLMKLFGSEKLTSEALDKHLKAIWNTTQGNPCKKCNRPKNCKLRINSK